MLLSFYYITNFAVLQLFRAGGGKISIVIFVAVSKKCETAFENKLMILFY